MRSSWLSREYRKIEAVNISELIKDGEKLYELSLPNAGSCLLNQIEFNKYINNSLNEIEWEKLFLNGLAEDINGGTIEIEETLNENVKFKKSENVVTFPLKVEDSKFMIILNPKMGSWMSLTEEEFKKYELDKLSKDEWKSLFIRGLAETTNDLEIEFDFPAPAEYPSVIVVNITTNCNLRCKYCFADCGTYKGEDMLPEVMDKTIENMLSMPEVKIITFEFQGGEASTNVQGIRDFIEKCEKVKDKYNKIVKYRTVVNCIEVSNELVDLIKEFNIETGISLDGPKSMTDISRIDINGQGAFDRIEKGIAKLRENGIYIDGAVCTLGQHNVHYPKEIINFFNEIGISFKPRPVNILGRGIGSELQTLPGEWAKCFSEMHKLSNDIDIENFSVHIFEENVYTPIRDYICMRYPCGAAREIVSVNPNGDVFPCDGFKGQDDFVMGNVLNEKIVDMIKKPKFDEMRNRTADNIEKCSKCMFRGMCCSCCYSAYGKFGSIYREDPHCSDRKQIYLYLMQDWIKKHVLNTQNEENIEKKSSNN